ncbi:MULTISPECIES: VOC family protein [unclassified Pseudodesulfovibrio]|uniref:VOC family protein n=1 Tax=unclassified Pseudodesulfovibrio TaxID=2661612 RepID=UPI000FEBA756|nr:MULTISPECIES: VOC family protein [unclassified Pseudodesulfovibrio]MCJ2163323.1 VOC family protein [Pseudodesulfovibrio sp. S3-i]RWU06564.1 VOC family protein [Pseudodesulfovibrio sp. S3]
MQAHFQAHGIFSWNELITTDLLSAKDFYGKLFGWSFVESTTIYGNTYLTAFKGETLVGGMMLKNGNVDGNVAPCWDPYVTVDDVDASAAQVKELGGTVVLPPTEIPNVGRFCVILDPQGISLNLITYTNASGE